MAWVVAGIPLSETLASVDFDGKTQESFQKVLKIVQQRKVVMLMSNEMDESMVLLSYLMDWDLQVRELPTLIYSPLTFPYCFRC